MNNFNLLYEQTIISTKLSSIKKYMNERAFQRIYDVYSKSMEEVRKFYDTMSNSVDDFDEIISGALRVASQKLMGGDKTVAEDVDILTWLKKVNFQMVAYYRD